MKKVLLATSALVMFAGAASAEIALSGSARMGLIYADDGTDSAAVFSSRVRIVFTASGETDGGLAFGASMRADQAGGNGGATVLVGPGPDLAYGTADDEFATLGSTGTTNGDSTVFISGAFGKLTMGDVGGAADALVGQTSGVGYGPYDALQEINFINTDKTALYYEYSAGAFTFGAGIGQRESSRDTYNLGVKYSVDGYSVALAYETDADANFDQISIGASATFGAATVKARISDTNVSGADTAYSLSVDYVVGATTITAFYTDYGNDLVNFNSAGLAGSTDTQHIGLGAAYDLGGGAKLAGGVVFQENDGVADRTFADVGLKFSF